MDLLLPDIGGAEVIKRVCSARSDTNFIVLTTVAGDEEIYRSLEAGARGYLFKDMVRKELIHAIRTVHRGQRYIPAQVGSRIAENLPRQGLSAREIEDRQDNRPLPPTRPHPTTGPFDSHTLEPSWCSLQRLGDDHLFSPGLQ